MGASGIPSTIFPAAPFGTSSPSSSTIRTSNPGIGFPALPGLMAGGASATAFFPAILSLPAYAASARPVIGDPDSVDHQLSTTCASRAPYLPRNSWYMETSDGSERSPARKMPRSERRPPRSPTRRRSALSGSSRLMARRAVGAVDMVVTPYSSTTRQKAEASGVPTGLPS